MPAITFTGLNGIDFNSILDSVMQAESQPLQQLQTEQTNVQSKDSAFVSLAGIVSALQAPVTALTGGTAFSNVAASSSDSSVATVTAGDGGSIGQYTVSVTQLAKAQVTKSTSGYSAATDVAATGGSISFTIGSTTTDPIAITADSTLSDLRNQINAQNSGVMASIVNDGTGYKLVISSRDTGATNGFTINNSLTNGSGTAVTFAAGQNSTTGNAQNAQNALLNVNGIDIESASNSVADALPGATINLLKAGDVSVNVTSDYSSIKNSLNTLVTQYNNLRQFYTQQAKGPLGGDPVLREVLNDIKSVLLAPNANGGQYKYLSEIGLELTASGDLKLDESKFDSAMSTNAADVAKLFQGTTSVKGAFNSLESTLDRLDGTAGLIKTARDSIQTTLSKYTDRIAQQQAMLDIRRQALQKMYAAADQAIAQLNQQTSSIANLQNSLG
jgi:flagellar hook-associated protein 2